jgi:hypothetical protein
MPGMGIKKPQFSAALTGGNIVIVVAWRLFTMSYFLQYISCIAFSTRFVRNEKTKKPTISNFIARW